MSLKQKCLILAIITAAIATGIYIAIAAPKGTALRLRLDLIIGSLIGVFGTIKFAAATALSALESYRNNQRRALNIYMTVCFLFLTLTFVAVAISTSHGLFGTR